MERNTHTRSGRLSTWSARHLNDLCGQLGSPVLQVVPIDGEHAVTAAEPPILRGQPPFQQVKNENSRLICPSHELNAELFAGVAFMKSHVEDVFPRGGRVRVVMRAVPKASLAKHGEKEGAAGLREHGAGVVVGHVADIVVVDLE